MSHIPNDSTADLSPTLSIAGVECPRCGYDLRGAVQSWRDSCPLDGRCAECGLDFEWWWMFRAQFHPWLFEHRWRKRPVRSALRTLLTAPRSQICREVTLLHPIRLLPLVVLFMFASLVALALSIGALAYALTQSQGFVRWGSAIADLVHRIARASLKQQAIYIYSVLALVPLAFICIPTSLQSIKVRPIQVMRITLYAFVGMATIILCFALLQSGWEFATGELPPRWLRLSDWRLTWNPRSPDSMVLADTVRPVWLLTIVWSWWWWRAACRDYLRLPDASLTVTMLMAMVALASYLVQHAVSVLAPLF